MRPINYAHSARANFFQDSVMTQRSPNHEWSVLPWRDVRAHFVACQRRHGDSYRGRENPATVSMCTGRLTTSLASVYAVRTQMFSTSAPNRKTKPYTKTGPGKGGLVPNSKVFSRRSLAGFAEHPAHQESTASRSTPLWSTQTVTLPLRWKNTSASSNRSRNFCA